MGAVLFITSILAASCCRANRSQVVPSSPASMHRVTHAILARRTVSTSSVRVTGCTFVTTTYNMPRALSRFRRGISQRTVRSSGVVKQTRTLVLACPTQYASWRAASGETICSITFATTSGCCLWPSVTHSIHMGDP